MGLVQLQRRRAETERSVQKTTSFAQITVTHAFRADILSSFFVFRNSHVESKKTKIKTNRTEAVLAQLERTAGIIIRVAI